LQLEAEARAGIYRLYCRDQWKPNSVRFWTCIHDSGHEPILQMGTDRMIQRHVYDIPFTVKIP
jgi:hypothetical protein